MPSPLPKYLKEAEARNVGTDTSYRTGGPVLTIATGMDNAFLASKQIGQGQGVAVCHDHIVGPQDHFGREVMGSHRLQSVNGNVTRDESHLANANVFRQRPTVRSH